VFAESTSDFVALRLYTELDAFYKTGDEKSEELAPRIVTLSAQTVNLGTGDIDGEDANCVRL